MKTAPIGNLLTGAVFVGSKVLGDFFPLTPPE
jgi:hypothetical protein